jgi:hypothetical protein
MVGIILLFSVPYAVVKPRGCGKVNNTSGFQKFAVHFGNLRFVSIQAVGFGKDGELMCAQPHE